MNNTASTQSIVCQQSLTVHAQAVSNTTRAVSFFHTVLDHNCFERFPGRRLLGASTTGYILLTGDPKCLAGENQAPLAEFIGRK
jgi:hypothetical protein